jgi:hypothetical protein
MAALEASGLGRAMRGSGVWTYGLVNLAHILGVSTLFGSVLLLDLRLLGFWQRIALQAIAQPAVPLATAGFVIAAASGICLIATNATEYVGNPFLYIKFSAIALGVANVAILRFWPAWRERNVRLPLPQEMIRLKIAAVASLLCWLTAVTAGRMIGYW